MVVGVVVVGAVGVGLLLLDVVGRVGLMQELEKMSIPLPRLPGTLQVPKYLSRYVSGIFACLPNMKWERRQAFLAKALL